MSFFTPEVIWFLLGLGLILLEFLVPGIILVFFGAGAWLVALTTWMNLTNGLTSQLFVFGISSVVLLVLLRRRIRGKLSGHSSGDQNPDVNLDEFAGKVVQVTAAIMPGQTDGKVEYKGAAWSAESTEPLAAGDRAIISSIEGIKLKVRPYTADQPPEEE